MTELTPAEYASCARQLKRYVDADGGNFNLITYEDVDFEVWLRFIRLHALSMMKKFPRAIPSRSKKQLRELLALAEEKAQK